MKTQLAKLWRLLSLPKYIQLRIMRLFQDEFLVGVTGVIVNENNEVLVCKHTYRQTKWSLPGGYMKGKEHPLEGIAREIEEETGFIVRLEKIIKTKTDRETARLDLSCIGTFVGGEFAPSPEVSEAQFFSFDTLPLLPHGQLPLIKEVIDERVKKMDRLAKKKQKEQSSLWNSIKNIWK